VPDDLSHDCFEALKMLAGLVCAANSRDWDSYFLRCALSAIVLSKGFPLVAEAVQELDDEIAEQLLKPYR